MKHIIEMEWWTEEDRTEPKEEHKDALVEAAMGHVSSMVMEGYSEGVLTDNIRMTNEDPDDGVPYRGYWKISEATAQENDQ